jgi:hypothetical protein
MKALSRLTPSLSRLSAAVARPWGGACRSGAEQEGGTRRDTGREHNVPRAPRGQTVEGPAAVPPWPGAAAAREVNHRAEAERDTPRGGAGRGVGYQRS